MNSFENFEERYQESRKQNAAKTLKELSDLFVMLHGAGIKTIEYGIDGSGDSGSIELVHIDGVDTRNHQLLEKTQPLIYDLLQIDYDGWETNSGGYGKVTLYTEEKRVKIEWNARMERTEHSEQNYNL